VDVVVSDQVVVLDSEDEPLLEPGELIDQMRQHDVDWIRPGDAEHGRRGDADRRVETR
jgi:hypothetical protein